MSHCLRLPMARSARGTADFAPLLSSDLSGLSATDVLETGLWKPVKALEAIRVDGRAWRDVLGEKREDCLGLEVRDHSHANTPRALATLLHCHQNEGRSSPLELSASSQTSLLAATHVSSTSTSPYSGSRAVFTMARRSL